MKPQMILGMVMIGLVLQWAVPARAADAEAAKRGKYLVTIAGCADCHTPLKMGANGPEPDMDRWLSGHPQMLEMPVAPAIPKASPWMAVASGTMTAWSGPWGMSFTANLTPDPETGLGSWTEEQFVAAVRTGRHKGMGRPILPPMPYQNVAAMTDEDLHAVFSYLQSIPAVKNKVPDPIPPAAIN
ncbi:MAG: c-type cytochrome [Candidatus Eisenbacteria bacterium]|uniref:C-type cytochrome n=1 Tax=Eiseniibacteriota bacterium TaxID=2212470 RepID=A0A956LWH2_UNCEI|nr:c-type cytochrome [Candidatus Eisenbacteria bacterium]